MCRAVKLLLSAAPQQGRAAGVNVADAWVQTLEYNNARACGLARNVRDSRTEDFVQQLLIYCDAIEGNAGGVNFGLSMLRETAGDDPVTAMLTDAILNSQNVQLDDGVEISPVHLALSRAAKVMLPPSAALSNDGGVLYGLAFAPNIAPETRIEAAERAVQMGVLPAGRLLQLYRAAKFDQASITNALGEADSLKGVLARALLYQAAAQQNIPLARAEIIVKAFELARDEGRYAAGDRSLSRLNVTNSTKPGNDLVRVNRCSGICDLG